MTRRLGDRRSASIIRLTTFAVALISLLLSTGCGGSTQDDVGGPQTVPDNRQAARQFLAAIEKYQAQALPEYDEARSKAYERERDCPTLLRPSDRNLRIRIGVAEEAIIEVIAAKAIAPDFRKLAVTLASIPTDSPVLNQLLQETKAAADRAAKLEAADIDLCRLIEEWKRTDWSRSFEHKLNNGYALYGVESDLVVEAGRRRTRLIPRLEELGLTTHQAIAIVGGVRPF